MLRKIHTFADQSNENGDHQAGCWYAIEEATYQRTVPIDLGLVTDEDAVRQRCSGRRRTNWEKLGLGN